MKVFYLLLALIVVPALAWAQAPTIEPVDTEFEKGVLTNGAPTGVWHYFDRKDELALTVDFDSNQLTYFRPDTARYRLHAGTEWQLARTDRPPHFFGSTGRFITYLLSTLRYPDYGLRKPQGAVVIGFTITAQGDAADFAVEQSLTPALDAQTLKAVQAVYNQWLPAIYRGQPTNSRMRVIAYYAAISPGANLAAAFRQMATIPVQPGDFEVFVAGPR